MADALVAALTQDVPPAQVEALWLTEPLGAVEGIAGVMFSGGVGEYVYGREARDFGDLGRRLGHAHSRAPRGGQSAVPAAARGRVHPRDRARRLGIQRAALGQHRLRLEPGELLPRKNLQVLQPPVALERRRSTPARDRRRRSASTSSAST